MDHKIYDRALKIVRDEFDNHFVAGYGPGFLQMESNADATVKKNTDKLAKWLEASLKGKKPEVLENAKDDDIRRAYIEGGDPTAAGKKIEYSAFKDIIEPTEGKRSWYDMDTEQLRYAMKDRGYRKEEMPEFLEKVSEHQQDYDIGQAIEEGLSGIGAVNPFIAPAMTKEAIGQSLAKNEPYSPSGMVGAAIQDAIGTGGMMAAPFAPWATGANEAANVARLGLTDLILEGQRQVGDAIRGNEYNPLEAVHSGVAAATIPALSTFVGRFLTQAGDAAHPLASGFRRGSRGGQDPMATERKRIKDLLLNAREQSKSAWKSAANDAKNTESYSFDPVSGVATKKPATRLLKLVQPTSLGEIAGSSSWDDAAETLSALGYKRYGEDFTTGGLRASKVAPGRKETIEDIIGTNPLSSRHIFQAQYHKPTADIAKILQESYDNPVKFALQKEGGVLTEEGRKTGKAYADRLSKVAKAKAEADAAHEASAWQYNLGYGVGQGLSLLGSQLEPAGISIKDFLQNPTKFPEVKRKARINAALDNIKDKNLRAAVESALKGNK